MNLLEQCIRHGSCHMLLNVFFFFFLVFGLWVFLMGFLGGLFKFVLNFALFCWGASCAHAAAVGWVEVEKFLTPFCCKAGLLLLPPCAAIWRLAAGRKCFWNVDWESLGNLEEACWIWSSATVSWKKKPFNSFKCMWEIWWTLCLHVLPKCNLFGCLLSFQR